MCEPTCEQARYLIVNNIVNVNPTWGRTFEISNFKFEIPAPALAHANPSAKCQRTAGERGNFMAATLLRRKRTTGDTHHRTFSTARKSQEESLRRNARLAAAPHADQNHPNRQK